MKIKDFYKKSAVSFFVILAVFGFFYAWRENIFGNYVEKGESSRDQGIESDALEDYLFADAFGEKKNSDLKIRQAKILMSQGDWSGAEKKLSEVLEKDDLNQSAFYFLGQINHHKGNYEKAEEYYERGYSLDPSGEILAERIRNLARMGDAGKARKVLEDSNIEDDIVIYYLGLISIEDNAYMPEEFWELGKEKYKEKMEAISAFLEDYVREDKNSDYYLAGKADLYNRLGETDFAIRNIETILSRNKNYRDAYLVLGKALIIDREYQEAADALEKASAIDVNHPETLFLLKEVYSGLGDAEKAEYYAERYEGLKI